MKIRCVLAGWVARALVSPSSLPAAAQTVPPIQGVTTTIPESTVADTLIQLARPVGGPARGRSARPCACNSRSARRCLARRRADS